MRSLGAVLLLALALAAPVAAESPPAPDWAYAMAHQLMSPFCPGRTLAECPSPQADELRLWILDRARAGASQPEIEAELFASFGDQLRQSPRAAGIGLVAYVVPALFVVAGAVLLGVFLRRSGSAA